MHTDCTDYAEKDFKVTEKDKKIILFTGALTPIKGLTYLIEAMTIIPARILGVDVKTLYNKMKKYKIKPFRANDK